MTRDRNQKIAELLSAILDMSQEERLSYIDDFCREDAGLKEAVERLLSVDETESITLLFADRLPLQQVSGSLEDPRLSITEGQMCGRYRIEKLIGKGGMGSVYKAVDTGLQRQVALKFLDARYTSQEKMNARFLREAKIASTFDHSNIITIHEVFDYKEAVVMVMAYIEGETLSQKLQSGPLPLDRAVEYSKQIAEGLSVLHESGVIHRDLKPSNIMVTKGGHVKILDLGLATLSRREGIGLTDSYTMVGTLPYMSPEQLEGKKADAQSDIWSLGVVMYEMFSGQRPFIGSDNISTINAILSKIPEFGSSGARPTRKYRKIISKALSKNPSERFASTAHLWEALSKISTSRQKTYVAEQTVSIELTIDRDFESFTYWEQRQIIKQLKGLLGSGSGIKVIGKSRGSVKLTIRISLEQAKQLLWLNQRGVLEEIGILEANVIEKQISNAILQHKLDENRYDVFMCHNSVDKPEVKQIAIKLRQAGILPWLDEWELRPGLTWQDALEKQIDSIQSAAVFIGNEGIGPWQNMEIQGFIRQFVERGCPVIPVLLKSCPSNSTLPTFLNGMTRINFRKRKPNPIEQLIWGISGKRPAHTI